MVVDYFAHCDKSTPVSQEVNQAYTLSDRQKEEGPLYAEMDFRGKRVKFQVDCGATVNVIPAHLVDTSKLEPSNVSLQCYNKTLKPVSGKSPHHSNANGKVEAAVKVSKRMAKILCWPFLSYETHQVRALTLHQHSDSLTAGQEHCYQ